MKRNLLIILTVLFTTNLSFSDNLYDVLASSGGVSIRATPGLNRLDSDIKPNYNLTGILTSPSIDLAIEYSLSPVLSAGMDFGLMMFNQEDNNERFVSGNVFTYNYLALDFVHLVSIRKDYKCSIWLTAGMGFGGLFRPYYTTAQGHDYIAPESSRKIPDSYFIFPVGLSFEYHLNREISLSLNSRFFFTNTDYLETVARHEHYDLWQNFGLSIRYKFARNRVAAPQSRP